MSHGKNFVVVFLLLITGLELNGQNISSSDLQIGVGLQPNYKLGGVNLFKKSVGLNTKIPHIYASWDKAFFNDIGPGRVTFGGMLSFGSYTFDLQNTFTDLTTINFHFITTGVRGNYVLQLGSDSGLEPYAGLQFFHTYLIVTSDNEGVNYLFNSNESEISASVLVGSRYMLSRRLGGFLELDPFFLTLKFGLVFKRFG